MKQSLVRLIDANELRDKVEWHVTSVSVCATAEQAKGQTAFKNRCLEDIDAAPTIDAIPVGWMREKMNLADDAGDLDSTDLISWLIQTWYKEQEEKRE